MYHNNSSDLDIFAHWVPPYYAQSAFDLTSSCLLNVTFLFFYKFSSPIDIFVQKQAYEAILYDKHYMDQQISCI